jgi:hypothetical protein
MRKRLCKKIFGAGVVLLLLTTAFSTAVSSLQKMEIQSIKDRYSSPGDGDPELCTFIVRFSPPGEERRRMTADYEDVECKNQYEVRLSSEEADYIVDAIKKLDAKLGNADTPSEIVSIVKKKMKVLRDGGILPPSFTLENLNKTAEMLRDLALDFFNIEIPETAKNRNNNNGKDGGFKFGWGYIGLGSGFVLICPMGVMVPSNFGTFVRIAGVPLCTGNVTEIHLFNVTDPETGKSVPWNLTVGWVADASYFRVITCSSITLGIALSVIGVGSGEDIIGSDTYFLGSFVSVWGPSVAASITILLRRGPRSVPIPIVDFGFVGTSFVMILPFWFEMREPEK